MIACFAMERAGAAIRRFGVSEASAVKWVERIQRAGDRRCTGTGGHRPSKVGPERDWLLAVIAAEPDIKLAVLSTRLLAERAAKADTSILSRFHVAEGSCKKACFQRTGSARRRLPARELETLPGSA